jgi:hypothetical protein
MRLGVVTYVCGPCREAEGSNLQNDPSTNSEAEMPTLERTVSNYITLQHHLNGINLTLT